ncbi:MAG TPA: PP2C family protein-serine/threonine phosphatase, partial [Waddliaceae bacterium]
QAMVATNNFFSIETGDTGMFATLLAGIYDWRTRILSYYSSGHNPGIVRRKDGSIETLAHGGIAMGVVILKEASSYTIQLYTGDTVVFYTDGVTEAHNEAHQLFTEERLIDIIKNEGDQTADELIKSIVDHVRVFAGKTPQFDDITLLVMKVSSTSTP